ncbi:MAG: hypothetical protein WC376_01475 [Candidatus Nanoarchaeia archaeon]|jgi:hypothetical protein
MASLLLEYLGESPKIKVIDFFIENLFGSYSKVEINNETKVSRTTLQQICDDLVKQKVLISEKKGNMILYKLNTKNEFVKFLINLDYSLNMARFNEETKKETVIKSVITIPYRKKEVQYCSGEKSCQ